MEKVPGQLKGTMIALQTFKGEKWGRSACEFQRAHKTAD